MTGYIQPSPAGISFPLVKAFEFRLVNQNVMRRVESLTVCAVNITNPP
jgi:hypothetical protein